MEEAVASVLARFAADGPELVVPPPLVNVSVPNTDPSGASSHAVARRLGRRIIHISDVDAWTAP